MKLIYALCGSFCTHKRALEALRILAPENDMTPAISEYSSVTNTRFGKASELISSLREITGRDPITSIKQAEETVTHGGYDALIISPCTGNTLAHIAHGMTDTTVAMCAKAQLRNRRPVIIALATNDGLSASLANIALTLERKNIYYVPFSQDAPDEKPSSLVCDFKKIPETLALAVDGRQIEPIIC